MNITQVILVSMLAVVGIKGGRVLSTLFAVELGAGPFAIGLLIATYALFPLVLAVAAGRIIDRWGMRMPLLLGTIGMCCGVLLPYFAPSLAVVYAGAALTGLAFIFVQISTHTLTATLGEGARRTRNFSVFALFMSVTDFIGPVVAGVSIDQLGHVRAYLTLGISNLLAVIAVVHFFPRIRRAAHAAGGGQPRRALDLVRHPGLLRIFLASGIVMTGIDLFQLYLPLYGRSVDLSATAIGLIMGACAVAGFAVRVAIPSLVKRYTEDTVLLASILLSAAAFSAIPLFSHAAVLAVVSFTLGLGLGLGQPLTLVLTANLSPPGRSGEALGMRLTVNNLTHVVMPMVFGVMGSALGVAWVFWITAVLLALGGWVTRRQRLE